MPERPPTCVKSLWEDGFFSEGKSLRQTVGRIKDKWGHNFGPAEISKALSGSNFLRRTGRKGQFQYVQKVSPVSKKLTTIKDELFAESLVNKLKKDFKTELDDLHHNFGSSGTCTAFILRKILEKLIFKVFAKQGLEHNIESANLPGGLVGLSKMISTATQTKVGGVPVLTPKTAKEIQGIKFLGDTAAHNPLINVDMKTIMPQMPFIITAYQELADRL